MRFKTFLMEIAVRGEGNFQPKSLHTDEWIAWVEKNCARHLKRSRAGDWVANSIYRGMNSPAVTCVMDTNAFTRRSANTMNLGTLWMDNDPAWAKFPKRSHSYICSTSRFTASGFGGVHLVIPADSAKIGIAPGDDIWSSFKEIASLDELNANTFYILKGLGYDATAIQTDWTVLLPALKAVTLAKLEGVNSLSHDLREWALEIIPQYGKNFYDVFKRLFDPRSDGFKVTTGANFLTPTDSDNEVWVQGEVALLDLENLLDAEDSKLEAFLSDNHLFHVR